MVSDDAFLPTHDDVLTHSHDEVRQGGNENGAIAPSDDTPHDNTLMSSDLCVHNGRNDDGDSFLSAVQVYQGGNNDGDRASYDDVLLP